MIIDGAAPGALAPDAPPIAVIARPLGVQTNNFAEYTAVVLALEKARALGATEADLILDSKLIVEQLSGRWKVRHPAIGPLADRARALLAGFARWSIRHEPRARNHAADALANLALDDPSTAADAERLTPANSALDRAGPARVIERLAGERAVMAVDGTRHEPWPVAIPTSEGQRLRDWVVRESATRTIEVGLGYGISTLFICDGLLGAGHKAARHLAIDPNQTTRFGGVGLQLLAEAGVARLVELAPEPSEIVLPRLLAEGRSFDFAFVDGNHRFDGVFVDLVYLGRLLRPGSVVFLDDYQLASTQKAVRFFVLNLGWKIEEESAVDERHAWVVARTSPLTIRRDHRHFVDF